MGIGEVYVMSYLVVTNLWLPQFSTLYTFRYLEFLFKYLHDSNLLSWLVRSSRIVHRSTRITKVSATLAPCILRWLFPLLGLCRGWNNYRIKQHLSKIWARIYLNFQTLCKHNMATYLRLFCFWNCTAYHHTFTRSAALGTKASGKSFGVTPAQSNQRTSF